MNRYSNRQIKPEKCACCAASVESIRYLESRKSPSEAFDYFLWHCSTCEMEFWTPLKMVPDLYENEDFEAYSDYHTGVRPFPPWARGLVSSLKSRTGRSLDVGCADGAIVEELTKIGFNAHGLDLDSKSLNVGRTQRRLNQLFLGTLDEFKDNQPEMEDSFDLVSFFEVLEHQPDPLTFMETVKSLGRSGGQVVGSVPNRFRFLVSIDRALGDGDYPPHHFLWFSKKSLFNFLQHSGIADIEVGYAKRPGIRARQRSVRVILERIFARSVTSRSTQISKHALSAIAWPIGLFLAIGDVAKPPHLFFSGTFP